MKGSLAVLTNTATLTVRRCIGTIALCPWVGPDALKAAVAAQITSGDDAGEPYVLPERAWESLLEADLSRFELRVAELAGGSLDDLATEVLWLCAAPELDHRFGRVFAYLLDSATSCRRRG